MNITFYKFGKPNNSTAIPGNTVVKWETTGQLKADSTINSPEIVLVGRDDISEFNYAYIPSFGRYYHVTECAWLSGRWSLSLACDPLASFRSQILASSQYVLRSASESDNMVIDSMYPTKVNTTVATAKRDLTFSDSGTFVIGCIGSGDVSTGGICYYALTAAQMLVFINALFTDTIFEGLTDTLKFSFNPIQYVVSCKWFPYDKMTNYGATRSIHLGWWDTQIEAKTALSWYDIDGRGLGKILSIDLPKHPDGGYYYGNAFTKYSLLLPGASEIQLDADLLTTANSISVDAVVDPITGEVMYDILYGSNSNCFVQGRIGVDIQLSQVLTNPLGEVKSIAGTVEKFVKGNIAGGIIGIADSIEAAMPSVSHMGNNGNRTIAQYQPFMQVRAEFYKQAGKNNTLYGSPLCATRTLSSLSGYTVCGNPQISLVGATAGEQAEVISALSEGVIIA